MDNFPTKLVNNIISSTTHFYLLAREVVIPIETVCKLATLYKSIPHKRDYAYTERDTSEIARNHTKSHI